MMREIKRRPPAMPVDAIDGKIAEAAMQVQEAVRLQSGTGMFMIVVSVYQGAIARATAHRCDERRAYCGERLT